MLSGILLGVKNEAAVAVFATFRNARVRHDTILAAAEFALDAQDLELLNALLTVIASAEKERDNLARGCYGVSTAIGCLAALIHPAFCTFHNARNWF
jgi:hypothetical protein